MTDSPTGKFKPSPHPVLPCPTDEARKKHGWTDQQLADFLLAREDRIAAELEDPFSYAYEPPVYQLADALLGLNLHTTPEARAEWDKKSAAIRAKLGFAHPVRMLLINGGNRGGKSEYEASRGVHLAMQKPNGVIWSFHQTDKSSLEQSQKYYFRYLPAEIRARNPIQSSTFYMRYTEANGFSDNRLVLPNRARISFRTYKMDKEDAIEGGEVDWAGCDELIPVDWVQTLMLRLATRNGRGVVTFTPVLGYNETVAWFRKGATTVLESIAYLCPADGGEPDYPRTLGLSPIEYQHIVDLGQKEIITGLRQPAAAPQSRPEDFTAWLEGRPSQPEPPPGRKFLRLPRVQKCVDPQLAVLFFYSSDNPYGNPKTVIDIVSHATQDYIKERFYGYTDQTHGARFPRFNPAVHCIPEDKIPAPDLRRNIHICDPCSGRNFFMAWFGVCKDTTYLYREWPGSYEIPDVGLPGEWTLPDGKRPDGRPGPAQDTFSFSLLDYKKEIARLEGWTDYNPDATPDEVRDWDELNGAREPVDIRFMDARAAAVTTVTQTGTQTLIQQFEDIGLYFKPAPGTKIDSRFGGVYQINNLLAYKQNEDLSYFNRPRILFADTLINIPYSLLTWTGQDGQKGASKDPIDVLRYFATSEENEWFSEEDQLVSTASSGAF